MQVFSVRNDSDYSYAPSNVPERVLLLAVLERALGDLQPYANHLDRRDALAWFGSKRAHKDNISFTFKQVIDYLGLTESQVAHIQMRVCAARKEEDSRVAEALRYGVSVDNYKKIESANHVQRRKSYNLNGRRSKYDVSYAREARA